MKNLISHTEKARIDAICDKYNITNYTINPDLSIDVNGNVDINSKNLTELPLQFNKVFGSFNCESNDLTTLKGSPHEVSENFDCNSNSRLTSLEGCPIKVGGCFFCDECRLQTLEFLPSITASNLSWSGDHIDNKKFIEKFLETTEDEYESMTKYLSYYEIWINGIYQASNMDALINDLKDGLR